MLIVPASKVSVPLTVVMRTAVSAAARDIVPPIIDVFVVFDLPITPKDAQTFPVIFEITTVPCITVAAAPAP